MSSWVNHKYNWLAGLFLLTGLAGTVTLSFVFAGGAPLGWNKTFTVRFSLSDGTAGLKAGSAVQLGGQQVGRVQSIDFEYRDGQVPSSILVVVQMRSDLVLFDNASITIDKPLLGTISTLNITSAGDPATLATTIGAGPQVDDGDVLAGSLAPPAFLAQAGFGPEQVRQVQQILTDASSAVADTKKLVSGNSERIGTAINTAADAIDDFATRLPVWSKNLEDILATITTGAERLDPILTKVEGGIDRATKVVDTVQATLDRNQEHIDSTFRAVDQLASGLAGDTLGFVLETARKAPEIAQDLRAVSQDARKITSTLAAELPNVRRTLVSGRQAADSLRLGIDEIVAQPWRILQRPTTKELREQLVYDSARAYAQAVGDLRSMAESLESVTATDRQVDPDQIRAMVESLRESLLNARRAQDSLENQLLELLITTGPGSAKTQPQQRP